MLDAKFTKSLMGKIHFIALLVTTIYYYLLEVIFKSLESILRIEWGLVVTRKIAIKKYAQWFSETKAFLSFVHCHHWQTDVQQIYLFS